MKIGVIGAGRLGICFALLCERAGYDVLVSDIREDYVNDLNAKKISTNEPEVEDLLRISKNFRATTNNKEVIEECDLIYTLVATPSLEDGSYDVSAVWDVVEDLKDVTKKKYFVVGCTTNPGDCDAFQKYLPRNVHVMYNPEFIAQGSIISDLKQADMVLLGVDPTLEDHVVKDIKTLYQKIQTTRAIVSVMSPKSAEITKIAVNCFLTTKISYANMLGDVLHKSGCGDETTAVLRAIGTDSRIGGKYLNYGLGYGGPCLPRDNRAFAHFAQKVGLEYNLGYVTDGFNNEHAQTVADYWEEMNKDRKPFYFEYISYKKGTDIITESQQYRLCLDLLDRGFKVYIQNDRRVSSQVSEYLDEKYGDQVRFVDNKFNITEDIFIVNL
jgi:UDPglucose 6-dehydrogenase|tara:strand:- start:483 stop:1634 length:1152 start_codon:yes stop_codon:yes gene_type:complete